jgi:hypothetical protein
MLALTALLGVGLASGCASGPEPTPSDQGQDQAASEKDRTPEAPTPEQLAESPCGNPNWARLPEEHREDGDPETDDGEATTTDEQSSTADSTSETPSNE